MEWISSPEAWIALATLAVLEIVLGIDNIVFISILADKLPEEAAAEGEAQRASSWPWPRAWPCSVRSPSS